MGEIGWIFTLLSGLDVLGTFVVLIAAAYTAFQLSKAKQGALGGWLLVLARVGVWLAALAFLGLDLLVGSAVGFLGIEAWNAVFLVLRSLILLCYLLTIVAFLLMRPSKEVAHG
jgi:hypothetical protein